MRCTDSAMLSHEPPDFRVERHHPMLKKPANQIVGEMPCQIIQDQNDA